MNFIGLMIILQNALGELRCVAYGLLSFVTVEIYNGDYDSLDCGRHRYGSVIRNARK